MIWYKIKPMSGIKFLDKYRISKSGIVKNNNTGYIYKSTIRGMDKRTYITLMDINGKPHRILLNRLVANNFIGHIDGMVVNHLDFDPSNNDVSNLEICTQKENIQYSINAGRIKRRGEDNVSHKGIFTEAKVRQICEILSNKESEEMSYSEILNTVGIQPDERSLDMMTKIRTGKLWTHISSCYDIPEYTRRQTNTYSEYKADIIKLINDGYNTREIADKLNIDISTTKAYQRFWKYVSRMRTMS